MCLCSITGRHYFINKVVTLLFPRPCAEKEAPSGQKDCSSRLNGRNSLGRPNTPKAPGIKKKDNFRVLPCVPWAKPLGFKQHIGLKVPISAYIKAQIIFEALKQIPIALVSLWCQAFEQASFYQLFAADQHNLPFFICKSA